MLESLHNNILERDLSNMNITFLENNKRTLLLCVFIALCLALFLLFPAKNVVEEFTVNIVFLLVIPLLYITMIVKKPLSQWGFTRGVFSLRDAGMIGLGLVLALTLFFALYQWTDFPALYTLPHAVTQNFWAFILYEGFFVGFFVILYEFFFRGFVLQGLRDALGIWAIALQWGLLFILFLLVGESLWQGVPFLISSFFAGIIAYRTQSLYYSLAFSFFFILLADALVIALSR